MVATLLTLTALAAPVALHHQVEIRHVINTGTGGVSIRLGRDPTDGALYYLRNSGSIYRLTVLPGSESTTQRIYTGAETGMSSAAGFAFGPEGTIYIAGNEAQGNLTVAVVRRGARRSPGADPRDWSTVARTDPYPLGVLFSHLVNGIAVSPDGAHLFVNSGARTDHGEVQDMRGAFPGVREVPLTACMFRLPAAGKDLLIPGGERALEESGYLYARGLRNSFDLAFSPQGELFATENSGDRDDSEEMNWIREGRHYGFPWRIGTNDTPQQFAGYDPESDRMINHNYIAYQRGLFQDDPSYPPRPEGVVFTDPVENMGPDADSFRDPASGGIRDGGDLGVSVGTFTPHRAPLGLVFDTAGALGSVFRGSGFVTSWTRGNPDGEISQGPFADPSEDLLHLELERTEEGYRMAATRIAGGFNHPVDLELVEHRLYLLEHGGSGAVWEITLPSAPPAPEFLRGHLNGDAELDLSDAVRLLFGLFAGLPLPCEDAADTDDSGSLEVADAILLLNHLFRSQSAPAEPWESCGPDPTPEDSLDCQTAPGCP